MLTHTPDWFCFWCPPPALCKLKQPNLDRVWLKCFLRVLQTEVAFIPKNTYVFSTKHFPIILFLPALWLIFSHSHTRKQHGTGGESFTFQLLVKITGATGPATLISWSTLRVAAPIVSTKLLHIGSASHWFRESQSLSTRWYFTRSPCYTLYETHSVICNT